MEEESKAFAALGDDQLLQNVARVANEVSAVAWLLKARLLVDVGDRDSVEHALALASRKRERALLIVRETCDEVAAPGPPASGFRERASARIKALQPALHACREQAPADDRPTQLRLLVELDPSGRVERATPLDDTLEPNRWGATETAYCAVRRFEATQFPAPGVRVALPIELVAAK